MMITQRKLVTGVGMLLFTEVSMTIEDASVALTEFAAKHQAYREARDVEADALLAKVEADNGLNAASAAVASADIAAERALSNLLAALEEEGITPVPEPIE
jgi:predicted DsbA family dithiol-disulfide isomerase